MSDKEVKELMDKLDVGLKLAEQRMLQEKSLRGESLIIYTEENGIQHVPPQQFLNG
jgi:hypothetical protein